MTVGGSETSTKQIDTEKLKKLLTYVGLPLLVLATLFFIFWLFRRRKGLSTNSKIVDKGDPVYPGNRKT